MITTDTARQIAKTAATVEAAEYIQILEAHFLLRIALDQMEAARKAEFTAADWSYLDDLRHEVGRLSDEICDRRN